MAMLPRARVLAGVVGVLGLVAIAPVRSVRADVLTISGRVDMGLNHGKGLGGGAKDKAFAATAPLPMFGVQVNVEALFVDVWLGHHQFANGSRVATWSEVGVGLDMEINSGQGAVRGPFFYLGGGLTFGVGTGQQVELPLDNSEISDKGFAAVAKLGGGLHLSRLIDVGIEVPMSLGYYFKSGAGIAANDKDTHYTQAALSGLVFVRARYGLK